MKYQGEVHASSGETSYRIHDCLHADEAELKARRLIRQFARGRPGVHPVGRGFFGYGEDMIPKWPKWHQNYVWKMMC